uniref:Protein TIC 214 n=1 Tax=Pelargonium pillansii TaxID=2563715 RepID=A0A4D5YV34_9ROSI|nr:Ycf1 [Pelargonium pillansii]
MQTFTNRRMDIRAALIFGLFYGSLITFSKITSYLFLVRYWIFQDEEGTGKARALSNGFMVGHLLGYLLIYYLPFYNIVSNFYLKIILALCLLLYHFFWTNHHLDIYLPKSFSAPRRDQALAFVYGFSYRLLNFTFFPNAIFSRMIIAYLIQCKYKVLYISTTFLVWSIGHLICIKLVQFFTLWLQKNFSAFLILTHQLYLQDKIKKIRSRAISLAQMFEYKPDQVMKPGIYREAQTIDEMIQILATILFIVALYFLGKSPIPFVPHRSSVPNAVEIARMERLEEDAKVQREIENRFYPLEYFEEEQKKDEKSDDEEKNRALISKKSNKKRKEREKEHSDELDEERNKERNKEISDMDEEELEESEKGDSNELDEEENEEISDMDEETGFENTLYTFFSDCFFESFSFYAFLFHRLKFYYALLFHRLQFFYGYLFDLFSSSSRFLNRFKPLFSPFLIVVKHFDLYFNLLSVYIPDLKFLKWFLFNHKMVFSAIFRGFSHFFFNPRRWVQPYRYIKTSFYEDSVKKGGFSQFGFYKCESDGKERTSFTYPLSLITFSKMIEGKLSLFRKTKLLPDRDRLYTLWVLRNDKKRASLNKELRKRVQKLQSGSPFRDAFDIRRKLFQFKYTPKALRSISETLFDQMHPSGGKKRENDPVWDGPSRGAFWYNHKFTKTAAEQRVDEEEHLQTMWFFFKDLRPLNQKEQYLILEREKEERKSRAKQKLRRQVVEKSLLGKTLRILKKTDPYKILLKLKKKTKKGTLTNKQKKACRLNRIFTRILVLNSNLRPSSKRNLYSSPNPFLDKINKIRRNRNTVYDIMNTYYQGLSGFTHKDIPKMRKKYQKYRKFQLKLRTIMKKVPRWEYNIDEEKKDYSEYTIRNDDVVSEDVYLRTRKAKFRVFRTKVWKYYERHEKRELKQWYFYRYAKITHFRRNMVKGADRTQRRKVTICGWYEHRAQSPLFLPKRRKTLLLILLTLDIFELMKKVYRFLLREYGFKVRVKRISERINRIWKKLWNLPDSQKSAIEAAIEAENELQGLREDEEDKKEAGNALEVEEWQERREAHEIRAICIAETWELLQSGHAIRSLILLIQSFLRKNVIFPLLIIAKNMARILLFQSPELFQDFADLKKETHTLCDFGGIPLDESQDPIGWFTDGCQIRIHFPFEWKPWREPDQSKESSVAEDFYLTVFGRITTIPFGTARKPYPFFKTVFEELKKKKASQELKNLLTSVIRKLQKKGFLKFKREGFLRKGLLAFQKKGFQSKLLKGVKVKKRTNLKKGPQSKLTKKKKERKVDKTSTIINEIERLIKEKKKRLFIIQTSISSTKTSSHSKISEALRRVSKIFKRRKARFIRKSKIFRKLIIEWIYVKILFDLKKRFLDEINKKRSSLKMVAQFFYKFKKKRKNKMIGKGIKGINKKKRTKSRFISTIKKHNFNLRNSQISNSQKTIVFDLSSLSQAYVFFKLSQTEKSSFRVSKFRNLKNFRLGMNRWKEWLRGHFDYYLLSDIRWSRLEAKKWRNKMNQCRTAENHNFKKGDLYEVDSLPINPQKLKFKKHLRYDLLAYSFLNAEYKKDPYVIAPSLVNNKHTAIAHLYNLHKDSLVDMLTSNYQNLRDSMEKHPLLDMHMDVNRTALRRRMTYNQIRFDVEDKKKGSKVVDKVAIDSWVTGQNRVLPDGWLPKEHLDDLELVESATLALETIRHHNYFSVYALFWPKFDRHGLDKFVRYEKSYDKRRTPIFKKQKSMDKRKKDLAARKKKLSGRAQAIKIAQREFDLSLILEPEEVEKIDNKNFFDWMGLNNENELEELMERNNDEKKSSFLGSSFFLFPEFIQLYNLLNLYAKAEWTTPIHSFLQNRKIRSRSSYADLKVEVEGAYWYMYDKKEWPAKAPWDSNRARRRRRHRRALLNLGRKDPRKETTLDIMIDPNERERAYAEAISEMKAEEQKKIDEEYEEEKEKKKKEQGKAFDETSYRKKHKKRFARVSTLKPIKYSRFRKTALKDLKESNYFRYQVHYSLRYLIADYLTNVTRTSQVTNKATNPKLLIVFIKDLIEMSQFGIMGTNQNQLPTLQDILKMGYLVLNPIRTFKRLRWERITYEILAISLIHKNQFQKLAYTPGPDNKRDPCLEIGVNKVKQTTYKVRKGRKVVESLSVRRLTVKRCWGLRVSYGKFGCPRSFWTKLIRYLVHPFAIPLKAKGRGKKQRKRSPWSYERVFGLFNWKTEVRPKKKRKRTPWSYERVFGQFHADQMRFFYKIGVCGKFKRECTAILLSLLTDPKHANDRIKKLILLDEGVPDTLVEKGLLVPENLLSPRRRRQLRILNELNKKKKKEKRIPKTKLTRYTKLLKETGRMDLNLLLRELDEREKRQGEERLNLVQKKEREQEELRKKEEESKELNRIRKKLMRLKFFLWPNYRLEDLACMNRYWFDTTNGSRFSMLRIRVYPRLKTR